jgi:3-dehydroquinate synthase
MIKVTVSASKKYDILIGRNLMQDLGSYVRQFAKCTKVAIISDSNIWPLYGKTITDSLSASNIPHCHYVFSAGEASKNGNTYLAILNFLAEEKITRSDVIIALGGGVVGDITGFAAATFLRGVGYIQIPTSLLAMVDSSVGGKTAIDLPTGKNLVGAFYQPRLVLCDTSALDTLPEDIFGDGCAEVIKYGILYDEKLFNHLLEKGLNFDREATIARCIELKANVVAEDEFDTGARQKLNLGHTLGHGIEAQSDFSISHGRAVAIGIALVSKAGANFGICSEETYHLILAALDKFNLPKATDCTAQMLFDSALSDKKRFGATVNLIIPQRIGECIIQATPVTELMTFIEAGL